MFGYYIVCAIFTILGGILLISGIVSSIISKRKKEKYLRELLTGTIISVGIIIFPYFTFQNELARHRSMKKEVLNNEATNASIFVINKELKTSLLDGEINIIEHKEANGLYKLKGSSQKEFLIALKLSNALPYKNYKEKQCELFGYSSKIHHLKETWRKDSSPPAKELVENVINFLKNDDIENLPLASHGETVIFQLWNDNNLVAYGEIPKATIFPNDEVLIQEEDETKTDFNNATNALINAVTTEATSASSPPSKK